MKNNILNLLIIVALAASIVLLKSCSDDDFEVPTASTQADFTYEVEIFVDDDTGEFSFGVQFTNKSILATSFAWDFGNGQTSADANPYMLYTNPGFYVVRLEVGSANNLYYSNLLKTASLTLGKEVVYAEDFQEGVDHPLGEDWLPEGWLAIDNDGDGFNWYIGIRQGVATMRSQSWDGEPLTPDNWLIMPEMDFSGINPGALITFRYTVGITANTPAYREEHYGIFISEGSNVIDNFDKLFEESLTRETPNWEPQERMIDLSEFAGKTVYVAIRHFNVTDMDRIFINEVEVYKIE
jgi:hypothetical protein